MKIYLTLLILIFPVGIFCQENTQTLQAEKDISPKTQSSIAINSDDSYKDDHLNKSKTYGYFNYFSIGSLIGSNKDERTMITSVLMEHNFQFNKNFAFGLVTGIEWLNVKVAPIGPNIKIILPGKNQFSYYLGASYGYSIALERLNNDYFKVLDTQGGKFAGVEYAIIFPSQKKFNFYIATGYRYQEFIFTREDWWLQEVENKTIYNRFSLKLGLRLY